MKLMLLAASCIGLIGCGAAAQEMPDPSKDIDCSIITALFAEGARLENEPEKQRLALNILAQWYFTKVEASGEATDPSIDDAFIERARKNLNADMTVAHTKFRACAARASEDSGFAAFSRPRGWTGPVT